MAELPRVVRRTALGVVLLAIGQLLLDGIDPYGIFSTASRGLQIALAIVLLAGILPGSYLASAIRRFSERASNVPRWRVTLIAIGGPLLIFAVQAYFSFGDLAFLSRFDDPARLISLWFSIPIALIQLAILTLNLLDLSRSSSRKSGA
ncbi:MAG: hypothetical protein ACRDHG_03650 [Anaerolineales bacterium]